MADQIFFYIQYRKKIRKSLKIENEISIHINIDPLLMNMCIFSAFDASFRLNNGFSQNN